MNKWTPIRVEWIDASSSDQWESKPDENITLHCESVGYFLREDEHTLVFTQNIVDRGGLSEGYCMTMAVPKSTVKSISVLEDNREEFSPGDVVAAESPVSFEDRWRAAKKIDLLSNEVQQRPAASVDPYSNG